MIRVSASRRTSPFSFPSHPVAIEVKEALRHVGPLGSVLNSGSFVTMDARCARPNHGQPETLMNRT